MATSNPKSARKQEKDKDIRKRRINADIAEMMEKSEPVRTGMYVEAIKRAFISNLQFSLAKDQYTATEYDKFLSLSYSVRDRIVKRWIHTQQQYHYQNAKRVYYLSMEFLIGRMLGSNIINLGIYDECSTAMEEMDMDLENVRDIENDAGLGNGGLGRLAACYLSSMAALGIPAHGYGIRYEYGMFHQKIKDGCQVETPDEWLTNGNPWELPRPEYTTTIRFYGRVQPRHGANGKVSFDWVDTEDVLAMPYDIPIPGYKNDVVNTLRLWASKSTNEFDLKYFNDGDYVRACEDKAISENISKVLYPNDTGEAGKELRVKQQYFFVAASIHDIIRRFKTDNRDFAAFPDKVAIQLNDTHPVLAIPELMRVFMDEEGMEWNRAWELTQKTFAYTNHTILPEALETWTVALLERLLPRHMQIIYEINRRLMRDVSNMFPADLARLERMSIIRERPEKAVRMANLAIVGSHSVNGVSQLHSDILRERVFKDFDQLYSGRFNNKTNGIEPRRWLRKSNPSLSRLITGVIGEDWVRDLGQLKNLVPFADDPTFLKKWHNVKQLNKQKFAQFVEREFGTRISPEAIFDVQVKRIHEYKRQLMNVFYLVYSYIRIKNNPNADYTPKVSFFGGKAAPGYMMAKLIIRFINSVAHVVNNDPAMKDRLKVVFLPNYRVSLAEKVFPASDLSEQISTAGMEASGTGNMKFALNGALTIGTLDGANIEIMEEVGRENIFIFGKTAQEIEEIKRGGYKPWDFCQKSKALCEVLDLVKCGFFSPESPDTFMPIYHDIVHSDRFFIAADFDAYIACHDEVSKNYTDRASWDRKSVINTACMGKFSSDRAVREYAEDIWKVDSFEFSGKDSERG